VIVFWYDLQGGGGHFTPLSRLAAFVLGDAKLGKLDNGATSIAIALELLHLMEQRGGVLHE